MHSRIRAAGIVIKDSSVLLMERKKRGKHYFVFPGGGVEKGEKFEETVVRELLEETSISVSVDKLVYKITYSNPLPERSEQYFYVCKYISGEPALHIDSIEQSKMNNGYGVYIPQWVPLNKIGSLVLYPYDVRDRLVHDISNGFEQAPYNLHIENY